MNKNVFCDQVVIVTGASAGIGRALVMDLARRGAKVVLAARRVDRLEQVAAECRAAGGEALVVPTDVSDEAQCQALVAQTMAAFGRLDMLVNNAGMAATALLEEFPDLSLFRKTMDINFYGSVCCTYYALPYLRQAKGRIVAISSVGGKSTMPYNTPYCASKYGLHGFYESLRMELAQHGVSITIICPWFVTTEFHTVQLMKDGKARGAERGRDLYNGKTMSAERCAEITLRAAYKRRREVLMGPAAMAGWLKLLAPGLLDWVTMKVFMNSMARRASASRVCREKTEK